MASQGARAWALVLGASSGMGKACVEKFHALGLNVLGVHFDTRELQQEVDDFVAGLNRDGQRVWFFNENAARAESQTQMIQRFKERLGSDRIKVLVHSIAFGSLGRFIPDGSEEVISRKQLGMTVEVMANTLVYWVQELLQEGLFAEHAQIFALTSAGGSRVWPTYGAVSAAKATLESHVRQLALELKPYKIAANAILAGVTDTPALRKIPTHEVLVEKVLKFTPRHRLTETADVADTIGYLGLAGTSWMTGNVIHVDGGETILM